MAEDIVTRLRDVVCWCNEFDGVCDACQAADEIKRLRRWKTEATTVLAEWDAVWECAGKGTLGESKQRGVVAELGRLDDEIERLRAALAIASGMISTMPQYEHEHPEAVMDMLLKEARRG